MKLSKLLRTVVRLIVSIAILLGCYILFTLYVIKSDEIWDALTAWRTSLHFDETKNRFDQIYGEVIATSQDDLLLELTLEPLHIPERFYVGCIRGSKMAIYGTNRSYELVLDDFMQVIEGEQWEHKEVSDPNIQTFYTAVADVEIEYRPSELVIQHPEWEQYQTIYSIYFRYAEPRIRSCWG